MKVPFSRFEEFLILLDPVFAFVVFKKLLRKTIFVIGKAIGAWTEAQVAIKIINSTNLVIRGKHHEINVEF